MRPHLTLAGVYPGVLSEYMAFPESWFVHALSIQGIAIGHQRALEHLVRAVDLINLKPVIDRRYTLDRLLEALARLDRGPLGKIIITMP
jgi:hypothetical protein